MYLIQVYTYRTIILGPSQSRLWSERPVSKAWHMEQSDMWRPLQRMISWLWTDWSGASLFLLAFLIFQPAEAGTACVAARRYTKFVKTQHYDRISSLFAPGSMWLTPSGKVMRGRKAIGLYFQQYLGDRRPIFRTDNYVDAGRNCVMEVSMKVRVDAAGKIALGADGAAAIIPDGSSDSGVYVRRAIDHFTVDPKGKITRMIVYNAPISYWR